MQKEKKKPVTMRIVEFREKLNQVAAESELPPFLLEVLIGEFLSGVSRVAEKEYAQDRAKWESEEEING